MVKEIRYTNIKRVLDNLTDHPLLRDLTLEQVVRYTIRFIALHGFPLLYQDKIEDVEIEDFRGVLPCDLISIIQVKEKGSQICMRSMTDTFTPGLKPHPEERTYVDPLNNVRKIHKVPAIRERLEEKTFKTQGRIIYTSFPVGCVEVSYKAIPVDEEGFPLLIDNENYLAALEAYIKKQVFTVKFETGKMQAGVLQNAQQDYAFLARQLVDEFQIPSYSEAESLSRMYQTLIPKMREFDNGFKKVGDREYLRKH